MAYTSDSARVQSPRQINAEQNDIRHRLLELGYEPFRNFGGKAAMPKGWPKLEISRAAIDGWHQPRSGKLTGTSVRVERGPAFYIDIDTDDPRVTEAVEQCLKRRAPDFAAQCVRRHSGGASLMLIGRYNGVTGSMRSSRFVKTPGDKSRHLVEVFGVGAKRQIAVAGPHTIEGDSVVRAYDYDGPPLWERPIKTLPFFPAADGNTTINAFLADCDEAIASLGLVRDQKPKPVDTGYTRVYDLVPELEVTLENGERIAADELEKILHPGGGERCFPPWDPKSTTGDRCVAHLGRHGLTIVDFKVETTHCWKSAKPAKTPALGSLLRELDARLDETANPVDDEPTAPDGVSQTSRLERRIANMQGMTKGPARPPKGSDLPLHSRWMLDGYGYCMTAERVVGLFATTRADALVTYKAFQQEFASISFDYVPEGATRATAIKLTDLWNVSSERLSIAGIVMRPDKPFPLFIEDGKVYKNLFLKPRHEDRSGTVEPWLRFQARFLPDETERKRYLQGLAYKWLHPEVPGPCIVFVADNEEDDADENKYGTGRGTHFKIIKKMWGVYAGTLKFDQVSGESSQAVFDDWRGKLVFGMINEATEGSDPKRIRARSAVFERLKEIFDPEAQQVMLAGKFKDLTETLVCVTFNIGTNHRDALPLPSGDRRFDVLTNGPAMTPDEATEINGWAAKPENIGALVDYLESLDLTGYNPYLAPPVTVAKARMQEISGDAMKEAFAQARRKMPGKGFTRAQIEEWVAHYYGGSARSLRSDGWGNSFDYVLKLMCRPVRDTDGDYLIVKFKVKVQIMKHRNHEVLVDGRVYAFTEQNRTTLLAMTRSEVRDEVRKNVVAGRQLYAVSPAGEGDEDKIDSE